MGPRVTCVYNSYPGAIWEHTQTHAIQVDKSNSDVSQIFPPKEWGIKKI